MASPMRQTRIRRAMKKAARGRRRKNHQRRHGTTPPRLPMLPTGDAPSAPKE